jgi:alginate O-acetyltransferase complex protein AlgF
VPAGGVAQRLVNPVRADVDVVCAPTQAVSALDVGALAAAKRYSLFLIPEGAHGSRLISAEDKKAGR